MSLLVALGAAIVLIVWVASVADIIKRDMDAMHTAGWILVVVLLPVLGSLLYWAMRRPTDAELSATVGARADLRGKRPDPPGGGTRLY